MRFMTNILDTNLLNDFRGLCNHAMRVFVIALLMLAAYPLL